MNKKRDCLAQSLFFTLNNMNFAYKILVCSLAVVLTGSTMACNSRHNKEKKIRKAAYHYLDAMANYRVDDAVPYCTAETQNGVLELARSLVKAVQPEYIKSDTPASITVGDIEITSDTTAIAHFHKLTPNKDHNGQVNLVKRKGRWLVHIANQQEKSFKDMGNTARQTENDNTPEAVRGNIGGQEIIGFPAKPKE